MEQFILSSRRTQKPWTLAHHQVSTEGPSEHVDRAGTVATRKPNCETSPERYKTPPTETEDFVPGNLSGRKTTA